MTRIRLYDHPFSPAAPKEFEADSLGQWLLDFYGPAPTVGVQVFAGEPSAETDITGRIDRIMANDAAEYVVLQSPGSDPVTAFYIVMAVVAVAMVLLAPKASLPSNINRTQQSPNNALGKRENQVRLLERVEDIYGTVRSIPSLMMPTYTKYINHLKYEYGYYCIGRGYYDLSDIRDGDTLIADISGASAAVYAPFTSPNSGDDPQLQIGDPIIDVVVAVARNIEVDGITLKAHNQVQLPASAGYGFTPDAGGDLIGQVIAQPNVNSVAAVGDTITVSMAPYDIGEWHDAAHNVVPEIGANHFHVLYSVDYSGSYTVAEVTDSWLRLTTSTFTDLIPTTTATVLIDGASEWTDWITLPATDRTEVWCNIVAPNGLFYDAGGKSAATTAFALEIEQLDSDLTPLGVVETVTGSVSGATSDERAETVEHATAWTGPARARMRRTTAYPYGFAGTVMDEIKWADLNSVSPVSKLEFGNKTTIHTITKATTRATAVKTRQLNCMASRLLPTYDGAAFSGAFDANGRHVWGTIHATAKLVDIIAAVSIDPNIGARDLATDIDLAQIWGVQQKLDAWHAEAGQFNFTFDSDNTSFEETIIRIADAGFCIAYRQSGKIRLALDEAQATSSALFTHRNKKPRSDTITRRFASDSEVDGIEMVYVDPDSEQSETIRLPLDGSATKIKKIEIAGIRSFAQAWLRANREYYKIRCQRESIETSTTLDARMLLPNSRIDIVDNTRFKSYDGEVVGQSGLELRLSQDVEFTPGLPHSIVLMRRDGSLQSIACTPGSAPNRVVLATLPTEAVVTQYGAAGVRTIYSFAADSARGAMAYLVQEIDLSDGQYAKLRAINYSASYYQADTAAIPNKDTIIN